MTTINTITDEQIRQLWRESIDSRSHAQAMICQIALGDVGTQDMLDATIKRARAACAQIISDAEAQRDSKHGKGNQMTAKSTTRYHIVDAAGNPLESHPAAKQSCADAAWAWLAARREDYSATFRRDLEAQGCRAVAVELTRRVHTQRPVSHREDPFEDGTGQR